MFHPRGPPIRRRDAYLVAGVVRWIHDAGRCQREGPRCADGMHMPGQAKTCGVTAW